MDEKVIDLYLGLAWELFSGFVLAGYEPAWAIERTEQAVRVWAEYEDRIYLLLTLRVARPTSTREENPVAGTATLETEYPAGLVAQTDSPPAGQPEPQVPPRGKFPYAGGPFGRSVMESGMLWDSGGLAVDPKTNKPTPEYDLMQRAPSPDGNRMDYPPDLLGGTVTGSSSTSKPPLDFSGRWITRGEHLVGVVSTTDLKDPKEG